MLYRPRRASSPCRSTRILRPTASSTHPLNSGLQNAVRRRPCLGACMRRQYVLLALPRQSQRARLVMAAYTTSHTLGSPRCPDTSRAAQRSASDGPDTCLGWVGPRRSSTTFSAASGSCTASSASSPPPSYPTCWCAPILHLPLLSSSCPSRREQPLRCRYARSLLSTECGSTRRVVLHVPPLGSHPCTAVVHVLNPTQPEVYSTPSPRASNQPAATGASSVAPTYTRPARVESYAALVHWALARPCDARGTCLSCLGR